VSAHARRAILLVLVIALGLAPAAAEAKKGKKQKSPSYYGSVTASGQWQTTYECAETSWTSAWQMEALYRKTTLDIFGQLDQTIGGASGRIDWNLDAVCNGNLESGTCSVGRDEFPNSVFFDPVKGGIRVDFELPLVVIPPCQAHSASVAPYGSGFETSNRVTREPQGFIPKKKIGRKVIVVPLSGNDRGDGPGRTFSGQMSGTLRLTKKKQLLPLPSGG
jgi:hypothetical protein